MKREISSLKNRSKKPNLSNSMLIKKRLKKEVEAAKALLEKKKEHAAKLKKETQEFIAKMKEQTKKA